jgi:hypothetical protein
MGIVGFPVGFHVGIPVEWDFMGQDPTPMKSRGNGTRSSPSTCSAQRGAQLPTEVLFLWHRQFGCYRYVLKTH